MNDRDALLTAILAQPGEDTPRLMLADWLEEHGNERDRWRGRFMREKFPSRSADLKRPRSHAAYPWRCYVRELFASVVPRSWVLGLTYSPDSEAWNRPGWWEKEMDSYSWGQWCSSCRFRCSNFLVVALRHGFATWLGLEERRFLRHARVIFRAQPIEHVALLGRSPSLCHGGYCWLRYRPPIAEFPSAVHPTLFHRLRGGELVGREQSRGPHAWYIYPTRREAYDALSAACVSYGREAVCRSLAPALIHPARFAG